MKGYSVSLGKEFKTRRQTKNKRRIYVSGIVNVKRKKKISLTVLHVGWFTFESRHFKRNQTSQSKSKGE